MNFLKTAPATGVLTLEDGISKSAQDHVVDLGKHGLMTHDGTGTDRCLDEYYAHVHNDLISR